jgi:H(+)-transporting ATP synthase, vacuolar type, subunit D
MANITVNPTRMELTRLKGKLRTAQRGHKLLKDKRDELMKQFLETVREVKTLRAEVEEELMTVHASFTVASALMSSEAMEQALLYPKQSVELTMTFKNIMSVNVPVYDFQTKTQSDSDIYPYGFAATSGELDTAVDALGKVFQKMLKLAQIEKSAQLMAEEIEKTRRRVNALEYVMIPNTQAAIRYITMYLRMERIRAFESKAQTLFAEGKIPGFVHLYLGEEAVATGVCECLRDDDYITSTHRGHGHIIAKGGDLKYMIALDGEREMTAHEGDVIAFTLRMNGPVRVLPEKALEEATANGSFYRKTK